MVRVFDHWNENSVLHVSLIELDNFTLRFELNTLQRHDADSTQAFADSSNAGHHGYVAVFTWLIAKLLDKVHTKHFPLPSSSYDETALGSESTQWDSPHEQTSHFAAGLENLAH
ncbi:hypothetical protein CKAH01_04192 [Colletotrichum kahawae]|uniref:Uncharacterized protein n=1 Tax=Colletotrichum kahawae TaxID=34407 RepID=A0AAD9YQ69_COLKA|nr:hypothetical protein CKAH01_04192 [Colletotrichum kahawae]